ncbi:3'-5' exonuclease [Limibacter armeniacum]|uniref:3'-5' exonuclease n=1 Tax=Limibacter armeniacum TaxID=466084 RepID=UPI002FE6248E
MNFDTLKHLVFLDIETVRGKASFNELSERMQQLWQKKALQLNNEVNAEELYYDKAGIYAEFGKIVCISIGVFYLKGEQLALRVKAITNDDEKALLETFKSLVTDKFDERKLKYVAHNGKEFDFPYICRRMLINGVQIPSSLQLSGKKPWEIQHIDTMELWKFGDFKSFTSLDLLSAAFDIPTPKDDIDGSQVSSVYYEEDNLVRIGHYCNKDVATTARVYLKMNGLDDLQEDFISYVS